MRKHCSAKKLPWPPPPFQIKLSPHFGTHPARSSTIEGSMTAEFSVGGWLNSKTILNSDKISKIVLHTKRLQWFKENLSQELVIQNEEKNSNIATCGQYNKTNNINTHQLMIAAIEIFFSKYVLIKNTKNW